MSLTSSTVMVILGWEEKHLAAEPPDGAISRLAARFIMIEIDNFTYLLLVIIFSFILMHQQEAFPLSREEISLNLLSVCFKLLRLL